ncbi:peptidoglycan DD-metalloendopeptidase family protein [Nocardia gipuzkoensis]
MRYTPMKDGTYTISSGFGERWGGMHRGADFAAADGTPFYAAQAGTVVRIGAASGFGQWLVIDHPSECGAGTTVYGHMWDAFATGLQLGSWVEAGQLIGYVGSNGGSTGPHLHFEVHPTVWRQGSQLDPMPWLEGAVQPDAPTRGPEPVDPGIRTWFGIDIASWQAGLDMARVRAEGFAYVIAKATEGSWYTNPHYWEQRDGARANALLFAAYHYVTTDDADAQAARYESAEPDRSIPVMLDVENGSGDVANVWAVHDAFVRRGYRVALVYLPAWYWSRIGRPDLAGLPPLMSSSYGPGSGRAGIASAIYPGDSDTGWHGYGGNHVRIFQFAERGAVAGMSLDVNAFRGTAGELAEFFTGEEIDMAAVEALIEFIKAYVGPIISDVKDIRQQLTGGRDAGDYSGWKQLGVNADGSAMTVVDSLADNRARGIKTEQDVAALRADVAALTALVKGEK